MFYCQRGFERREMLLKEVKRFDAFEVMFYRNTLADHQLEVSWTVAELLPYAEKAFSPYFGMKERRQTIVTALVHDDAELRMVNGDVNGYVKSKMSSEELEKLKIDEEQAIEKLTSEFPEKLYGFCYKDLMLAASRKNTLVSQLVSYADKITGFCEVLHELYAGNRDFIVDPVNKKNHPGQWYVQKCRKRKEEWPLLEQLFHYNHPFLNQPQQIRPAEIIKIGSLHTADSIVKPTGYPMYDLWREVIAGRGGKKGLELLVKRREC